jgi:cytidylate kinase
LVGTAGGVIVVSGIMAAGKATVSQLLASRFDRGVHLRGDLFRRMIVTGQAPITPEMDDAAFGQLKLRYRLACQAADSYAKAGFTVVLQDVVVGELLAEFIDGIETRPRHVVVLTPKPDVVLRRENQRSKAGYNDHRSAHELDEELHAFTPRRGLWLDNSHMTPEQTVDAILDRLDEALID